MGEPEELSSHTADAAFPQELFDCLLENVVDRQTIAKCALVNRSWGRRCQELIFREISLYADDDPQVQALLELLTDSPHIRPLIRELSIYNLPVRMKPEPQFDNDIGFIISCAVNLTHFTLQFNTCGRRVRYGDLPDFLTATVRPALRHLAHLYSVTFCDNAWLTGNVVNLFRACDGSTVTKISVIEVAGVCRAYSSAADNLLSFPNVTEIEFRARRFMDASLLHPWLSRPLQIFPRLRTMTFGVSSSQGVNDIHVNLLSPKGLPGLRCFKVVWHASTPTPLYLQKRSGPNSAAEITMPMLAIGTFPEVILEYRVDVYNDIAILWWCRVFENLEVSVIETLNLVVYIAGEDLTSFEPWEKLDGILSSWRFHSLKEFTLQFWVTPFKSSGERQNNGRVELSRLAFPEVSRKVKTHISVDTKPVPKFWLNSRYNE